MTTVQTHVDLSRLDRYLSVVEEELREVNRISDILSAQIRQSDNLLLEWEIVQRRQKYLEKQRESVKGRLSYLGQIQEKMAAVTRNSQEQLKDLLMYLQHTT